MQNLENIGTIRRLISRDRTLFKQVIIGTAVFSVFLTAFALLSLALGASVMFAYGIIFSMVVPYVVISLREKKETTTKQITQIG